MGCANSRAVVDDGVTSSPDMKMSPETLDDKAKTDYAASDDMSKQNFELQEQTGLDQPSSELMLKTDRASNDDNNEKVDIHTHPKEDILIESSDAADALTSTDASTQLLPVLDREMAINQVGGDIEFLIELMTDILKERPMHMDAIRKAMSEDDYDSFRGSSHTVKGSALNIGLKALGSHAYVCETHGSNMVQALKDSDLVLLETLKHKSSELVDQFEHEYTRLNEVLDAGVK